MKRFMCTMLAVVMAMTMFMAGCGKTTASEPAPSQESQTTAAATQEEVVQVPAEAYELSWYFPGSAQKDNEAVEQEVNKYLKDKINATVKLFPTGWESWEQKIKMMIAAGDKFDIVWSPMWWGYHDNVAKGAYEEMDELLDKYAPKTKELLGESLINGARVDGKLYALPVKKDTADSRAFMFNKALVDKYGFDVSTIQKPEDIEPWLQIIKDKEPGVLPFGAQAGQCLHDFIQFDAVAGDGAIPGAVLKENQDKVVNQFENPKLHDAWRLLYKWYKAGYIEKEAGTTGSKLSALRDDGKVFVFVDAGTPGKDKDLSNEKAQLVMKRMTDIIIRNSEIGGSMHAISQTSKDPARAMMFLELMNTDKYLNNLVNYGIENKHYKKIDDNTIDLIPDSGYAHAGMQWMFANNFINYLKKGDAPDKLKQLEEYSASGMPFKSIGFVFKGRDALTNEYAALKNVAGQYNGALNTGSIDPEKAIPEYLAKLEAAGAKKVIEAIDAEYQAFLKK